MATTLPYGLTRAILSKAFNGDDRIVRAFEKAFLSVASSASISTSTAEATTELQDATVVTLSANAAFTNERRLAVASPLAIDDEGPNNDVIIGFQIPLTINGDHALIVNLLTDTNVTLPPSGRLLSATISDVYVNDAAADAGGIAVGEAYRQPAGLVVWRQV